MLIAAVGALKPEFSDVALKAIQMILQSKEGTVPYRDRILICVESEKTQSIREILATSTGKLGVVGISDAVLVS